MKSTLPILLLALCSNAVIAQNAAAPAATPPAAAAPEPTLHPALFLVGDSIMATPSADAVAPASARSPWGFGHELIPLLDSTKIHAYNTALGGRSSRGFMEEGAWDKVLARMQPGDFVLMMFAHNDANNSANYPDRATITGSGDETVHVGVNPSATTIYTYGAYLKQYVADAKAKGVTVIILTPTPRNTWANGKIVRGFDGYAQWATDAAKASGAPLVDLNTIAANHYDEIGQPAVGPYFADNQHPSQQGAKLITQSVIEGLKQIKSPLANDLLPAATAAPAAPAK